MSLRRLAALAAAAGFAALPVAASWPVAHARRTSPDGRFDAVAWTRAWRSFVPAMPGGGSDKQGWIEIVRQQDGRSCGSIDVPMVWFVDQLDWSAPGIVGDGGGAWDLEGCRVERW